MLASWCSKCFFDGPAASKASKEEVSMYSESSRPVCNRQRQSVVREVSRCAFIVRLLLGCLPATVIRLVIAIVINASDRVFLSRLCSHVIEEVRKGFQPSRANSYSSPAIVGKRWVVVFVATKPHLLPASVFARSSGCVFGCMPMSPVSASRTARSASPEPERDSSNDRFSSALTSAEPVRAFVGLKGVTSIADNCELSVDVTCLVFDARRQLDRIIRRHSSTPSKLDFDRAARRLQSSGCSHYYVSHGKAVQ